MVDFLKVAKKTIVIAGVSGDIGAAIAMHANIFSVRVLGFDIKQPNSKTMDCLELFYKGDATAENDVVAFMNKIKGQFDIDAVICCAGLHGQITDSENIDIQKFIECINSSVLSSALFVKYFTPIFKLNKNGNFILFSSTAGTGGVALMPAYTAAKHAVNGLVKSFARELGPWGIRVNCILPGAINSSMVTSIQHALDCRLNKEIECIENYSLSDKSYQSIPLKRLGTGEDISSLALFLISSASSYIHGSMIHIDGGLSVKY